MFLEYLSGIETFKILLIIYSLLKFLEYLSGIETLITHSIPALQFCF